MTTNPNQQTYNYNCEEVPFKELPQALQGEILEADDFWSQVDNAPTQFEREEIFENHPYNN